MISWPPRQFPKPEDPEAAASRLALEFAVWTRNDYQSDVTRHGYMNKNDTSEGECSTHISKEMDLVFVFLFTVCVCIINQAEWIQMPTMVFIFIVGYVVNWRTAIYFKGSSTVSNTLGALAVGMSLQRTSAKRHRRRRLTPPASPARIGSCRKRLARRP